MSTLKQKVLGALGGRWMAQARVDKVEIISDRYRLIDIGSDKFKDAAMLPAAKVRLNAGDWNMRAYTPLSIDPQAGRIRILAYLHGEGPGAVWARAAAPGDLTQIIGPSMSLDLMELSQPAVFFGDETSFAAAKTLQSHLTPRHATRFIFEVSSTGEAKAIADRLELRNVEWHERRDDDAHSADVATAIRDALAEIATPNLVLTGNGRSIQAVRTRLRTDHAGVVDYRVKAYWAPGKIGLE